MKNPATDSLFRGFSKLSRQDRFDRLIQMGALTSEDVYFLSCGGIQDFSLADKLIENVIGYFQIPLGVATNFKIDNEDYVIPLAVEETSIIAALSKTARWIRECGTISTGVQGVGILGQIQFPCIKDFAAFEHVIIENKACLIALANQEVAASMVARGGGVIDITVRALPKADGNIMGIVHVSMNCCDAMGANILNQILEFLKQPLEALTGASVNMCILTNLNDTKLTWAEVVLEQVEPDLGLRLQEASYFAEIDPYRAATHNKGVMNGMDAVLIATGNDWRAVEAGVHAYAARSGQYRAITIWRYDIRSKRLTGRIEAPVVVGTVGGVTALHPTAKLCLRMLGVTTADHLSRIIAAVGLVQNLGALRALCTDGIIRGHMKLHIDNLALNAGACAEEMTELKMRLSEFLQKHNRVSLHMAHQILSDMRAEIPA